MVGRVGVCVRVSCCDVQVRGRELSSEMTPMGRRTSGAWDVELVLPLPEIAGPGSADAKALGCPVPQYSAALWEIAAGVPYSNRLI